MNTDLKNGWLVQLIMTLAVVLFGIFLVKRGATLLFKYFKTQEQPGHEPLTRNLVAGIGLAALGVLLIVSFLMSSPLAFNIFT